MLFAAAFAYIYASIFISLVDLTNSSGDKWYFMQLLMMASTTGVFTTLTLAAILGRELIVRDLYLLITLFSVLLSGYSFNISFMTADISRVTELNPMRWLFEFAMIWEFKDYVDGPKYLATWSFTHLNKSEVYPYLRNFYYFSGTIFVVFLFPFFRYKLFFF
jgi:hypothetical protein